MYAPIHVWLVVHAVQLLARVVPCSFEVSKYLVAVSARIPLNNH
jgi:hypothetical protein